MSIVPYRDTRKRRERKQLDRQQIVKGALALLDEVGLDGLTMRSLAEKLGVQAASLYRHVRDKQELLILLADEISAALPPVETQVGDDRDWKEALGDMARSYRQVLLSHRDGARLLSETWPAGPERLLRIEALLELLIAAGFSPQDAVRASYHFNNLVTEFVADEARMATAADVAGATQSELIEGAREQYKALPEAEFPNLTRYADYMVNGDSDALFQFGLDLCINGLESFRRPAP
ncbi:MAG: TetR/AcrR family transcriptional regulator C-terminal domain-containing protein [Chloroflexota bacterium]